MCVLCVNVIPDRPQLLVLTGPPSSRPDLVYFAYHISKDVGSMICGEVLQVCEGGAWYTVEPPSTLDTLYKTMKSGLAIREVF